jgi:hypothetical protein
VITGVLGGEPELQTQNWAQTYEGYV